MNKSLTTITSGEWSQRPELTDYRAEWLSDMLVERVTCAPEASIHQIGQLVVGAPGYVCFRFWLANGEHILEKYFDEHGRAIGMYARIGMAAPHKGRGFSAMNLLLGLWISEETHVTVLNEMEFDRAVREGAFTLSLIHI